MSRGVVAAGHPLTAETGAWALREGGNAVDAAIAAVASSCVTESPLTGLGAGGYMLVHDGSGTTVLDFFVAAPGADGVERRSELVPIEVHFTATSAQVFNVGAASCGVPGTPSGLVEAARRFGTMPLAELVAPATRQAREGVELSREQAYFVEILAPILTHTEEGGRRLRAGRQAARHRRPIPFPRPRRCVRAARLGGGGAVLSAAKSALRSATGCSSAVAPSDDPNSPPTRRSPATPAEAGFRGKRVLTNPPPSSGGVLIAYVLELLARETATDVETLAAAMEAAQSARTQEFVAALNEEDFAARFLADRLGSTTHITAVDDEGTCASVTCSNGTGSGMIVPGTGVHVNNMLGEQDLNPLGFHRYPPGRGLPSMMSPTVVLDGDELVAGLGSGGSNRIRSAIVQAIVGIAERGLDVAEAVEAPRIHLEDGVVEAEPGIDEEALERLAARGYEIVRWSERNVFFGGVHAVARDPLTGRCEAPVMLGEAGRWRWRRARGVCGIDKGDRFRLAADSIGGLSSVCERNPPTGRLIIPIRR